ncbi:LysM peptidoglycan-binding domain-containing protein [Kineococcus indalonis]|uniref:LysM peptidoglycan-binding domain-containing protein n=1 Tax=Kineococcus indalonis TaxID=2696566 RepID=UPI001411C771|nr:LysM peptidoglycan-binding domain-containing protein [Kineococcus indalonis]NAZ86704.1 LysM peptidoglycan-binding domain-containing protein [Kineococcus indalonis]
MAEHGDDPTSPEEPRRRSRWLAAAALVGAAGPTAVVPAAAAATGAAAPTAAHASATQDGEQVVTVRRGDTVGGIAARTGSSVGAIVRANGLDADAAIVEGQRLRVPAPGRDAGGREPAPAPAEHTVVAGETLSSIAALHGTTVGALREANGLDARGFIRAGQVLKLGPSAGPGTGASSRRAEPATYVVRPGDTLSGIAARTGTTVATLVELNGLDRTGFIVEGQELVLAPEPEPTPAAPPAAQQAGSVSAAVQANRSRLARADLPGREEMREIIRSTAVRLGVDPSLALAIGYQESGFNMGVVSHANAIGAMQVIPSSGEWASDLLGEEIDLFDPRDNARAGVVILRTLVASNPPDIAIASYYQGQASVRSRGMYDDTRRYVANVQTLQARFR